jgi:hypothetical protein
MMTIAELEQKWSTRRDEWRVLGVRVDGERIADEILADIRAVSMSADEATLTPSEAAAVAGYHPESICRLIRKGKLRNFGTPRRPRVRVSELTSKAHARRAAVAKEDRSTACSNVVSIDSIARDALAGRLGRA